ncbi:DUF2163 domain-containing protein [Tabrizicola oligotrophica]|uniref:DUF2163 domain-containing protein n=1 Tax=Tabrizicola oligotrophica TaxID=2710650 RepID=A0A6M0QP92_9RHOB|nr:DUF2163 domain-containing protein [Tabrizicola oligotrophica]NEY89290.1 DUF2163 domain-containing protein [Tabrizicola oligotrophica]
MTARDELLQHLAGGVTSVCHCWLVTRTDGERLGFTDHDGDLSFDGHVFRASTGLSAGALQQTTGLSVDNSEAVGALSDASVSEADLAEGRFDGAEVQSWLVNWADVTQRMVEFRGNFGEVTRKAGAFRVELRGLTERLNQVQGRVYQAGCGAVLGDGRCGINLASAAYRHAAEIAEIDVLGRLRIESGTSYADRWFERGQIEVLSGSSAGMAVMIKGDRLTGSGRVLDLWHGTGATLAVGDSIRLQAGCDRRAATCRDKFGNFANFRGFPHVPGEDWLTAYPASTTLNDGGSLQG